ncbi:hypothetical protein JNK13_05785 [bacterium]|nr:hypothetical protein [bacterium]
MAHDVVVKLFTSLDELERAVRLAKSSFTSISSKNPEILRRVEAYEEMLLKQRKLAQALADYIDLGNWDEVSRHIKLINGLSIMIQDDAKALVAEAFLGTAANKLPLAA